MDSPNDETLDVDKESESMKKNQVLLALSEISSISLNRHGIEILIFIANNHPRKLLMKDIAEGLNLNKNHLSKIIFDLLSKGMITKTTNITDVRSTCINISNKGLLLLYSIYQKLDDFFTVYKAKIDGILLDTSNGIT